MSRSTDFEVQGFKHMPDYWSFRSVADTDLFKWRTDLEKILDEKHDQTSWHLFSGSNSVEDDFQRHVAWTEHRTGSVMSAEARQDLKHMLSLRGVLEPPEYDDKPVRGAFALKAGGGRRQKQTMRPKHASTASLRQESPDEDQDTASNGSVSDMSIEPDAEDTHDVDVLNAPVSSWRGADLLAGLGKAYPKPGWFNDDTTGYIRGGTQVGLTCGYFAVRHALHPVDIGPLSAFEDRSGENRLCYPEGDYDFLALQSNCSWAGFRLAPLSADDLLEAARVHEGLDHQPARVQLFMPGGLFGNVTACLIHRPGHWLCLKALSPEVVLLCDSLWRQPYILEASELSDFFSLVCAYQQQAPLSQAGEWSVFAVSPSQS